MGYDVVGTGWPWFNQEIKKKSRLALYGGTEGLRFPGSMTGKVTMHHYMEFLKISLFLIERGCGEHETVHSTCVHETMFRNTVFNL